tara:strand:+ start:850 stop:1518 length:669 start_codon:yes stop_codon:yes gene_type:complete
MTTKKTGSPSSPKAESSSRIDAKGSPLRPEQFPEIAELARLAAVLASGNPPSNDEEAHRLTDAALRLWRNSRDAINEQRSEAVDYWQSIDEAHAGISSGRAQIKARLERLNASGMEEAAHTDWKSAASVIWKDLPACEREERLAALVADGMVGQSFWNEWQVSDFKKHGFSTIGFLTLVQIFDQQEIETEAEATREKMQRLGKRSATIRKAKKGGATKSRRS